MKEIKTVMDRLEKEHKKLEEENAADLSSINDKQANINTLTGEISELQNAIEARKENMTKLEQKIAETKEFEKSIEEVAPLITEEVKEEPKEEVHEEEPVNEEVKEEVKEEAPVVEENKEENIFPFGDITTDLESKDAPFEFKNDLPEFNASLPEVEETKEENVNPDIPMFDANGFDISANTTPAEPNNAFPNIGLNEAYNTQIDDGSMKLR